VILMEPIGFAMSLLPPVPQEMILVHHPWRPSLYTVHTFSYER